ncbi:MAG TPA: alpha/beta hydrolase [Solirubrobacteraceae bacterium]|jgi:pimeloyl-ACP methyl ester carboxylesterase|nr:alpha/beta hydrolase [Solirubrobacteraceae bacterium]
MRRSAPVDGFELAYERVGPGRAAVVLLHGWPGDHRDWRDVAARLAADGRADVVIPDLRGFGASDKHPSDGEAYSAAGQAASVRALIGELDLERPVIAGYDIGSRIAQQIAREAPGDVAALVVAPPLPGVGRRVLSEHAVSEFWYQRFHRLPLVESILDGHRDAVRSYLGYIWEHWSGPDYHQPPDELERLTGAYGAPGAFVASIGWYRAGAGTVARSLTEQAPAPADRLAVPTTILWPEHDPLFPLEWSDRIEEFFSAATLHRLAGVGHFSPLEAPERFAAAIADAL